jgi:hypothetical protein
MSGEHSASVITSTLDSPWVAQGSDYTRLKSRTGSGLPPFFVSERAIITAALFCPFRPIHHMLRRVSRGLATALFAPVNKKRYLAVERSAALGQCTAGPWGRDVPFVGASSGTTPRSQGHDPLIDNGALTQGTDSQVYPRDRTWRAVGLSGRGFHTVQIARIRKTIECALLLGNRKG